MKTLGPLPTPQLAERSGLTIAGVRKHLQQLEEAGHLKSTPLAKGKGRPVLVWQLTATGHAAFSDSHAALTLELLAATQAELGSRALDRLLSERERTIVKRYRGQISRSAPPGDRLSLLAELRSQEGYMAETEEISPQCWRLTENHCPIAAASNSCRGLCTSELQTFRKVLGSDLAIEREDYLHDGGRCCTYIVRSQNRAKPANP